MSISKIKTLQGKITKKFKVYTSFQCNQGFSNRGEFYVKISVYDEVHSHRGHKSFATAVEDLEHFLVMSNDQFKYESAKEKAEYKLTELKNELEETCDEIANLELILRKIELKENVL